jgi:hypothetical protein
MKTLLCALLLVLGVGQASGQEFKTAPDTSGLPLSWLSITQYGGYDPSSSRFSFIQEVGWFGHDSLGNGLMLGLGYGLKLLNEDAPVSYIRPHSFRDDSTFGSAEYDRYIIGLLTFSTGYYFESGLGLSAIGGVAIAPKVTLESSPLRPGHYWEKSSRTAYEPLFGGTISYRVAHSLAMRAGYVKGQGIILGYTVGQFQPAVIREILDTMPKLFPYIGFAGTYGGVAGGWGFVLEQGQLRRDSIDGSAWGSGIEMGFQITPSSVPSHLDRPFAYSGKPIVSRRYSESVETSVCLNQGGYFANGFGIFPTIGLSMGRRVTIKNDQGSPTSPYRDSEETVFFLVYGGQLRYMFGNTQLHAGYTNRRGALVAFSVRNFLSDWLLGDKAKRYYE